MKNSSLIFTSPKTRDKTRPSVWFLLLLLLLFLPAAGHSLTFVKVSDTTLADRAEVIVEVRVLEIDTSPDIGRPVTDYLMAVDRVIHGDVVASPLTVRVPGGILPSGMALRVYGAPSFKQDQRALLFLTSRADGTYQILHFLLGAFHLVEHAGQSIALRRLADAEEISIPGRVPPRDGLRDLARFRSWLEDRAQSVHRTGDYFVDNDADLAGTIHKFTILTGSNGRKIRWRRFDSGGSTTFRAHSDGQPGVSGGGFSQFRSALAAWTNDANTPIRYLYGGTTSASGGLTNFDNINAILFDDPNDNPTFDEPFNCSDGGTIAIGGPWFDPGDPHSHNGETFNTAVGGDIVTNKGIDCLSGGQPWFARFQRAAEVFTHELGHTLGLGHSCGDDDSPSCGSSSTLNAATMRATVHSDSRGAQLRSDDRAAIRFLYGDPLTPPTAPSGLTATVISGERIDLSWNDNSVDEDEFRIERRLGGGSYSQIATPGTNTRSFQDTTVLPAMTYTYRVRASNEAGNSGYSNTATAGTPEGTPSALATFATSDSKIQLTWQDNSSGEGNFQIDGKSGSAPFSTFLFVDANTETAMIEGLDPVTTYTFRVRAIGGAGDSAYSNETSSTTFFSDPDPCVAGPTTLCLKDDRFKVEVTWTNSMGQTGTATDAGLSSTDSGLFYFFSSNNWEMLVKVIDGCSATQHFWVFAAATTDVAYDLVVTDSVSGFSKTYSNQLGVASPAIIDTSAFPTCFAEMPAAAPPVAASPTVETDELTVLPAPDQRGSCVPNNNRFCFNGGRYAVELVWRNFSGESGLAQVDPLQSSDSGLFYFVDPQNLEVLVKVLDGCAINNRVWVFAAATTNLEYTLRVLDTVTDISKDYFNELGNAADAITDTDAFASCP